MSDDTKEEKVLLSFELVRVRACDDRNLAIERRKTIGESAKGKRVADPSRVGTHRWEICGYYGSLADACRTLLSKHWEALAPLEQADAKAVASAVGNAAQRIEAALREHAEATRVPIEPAAAVTENPSEE